MSRILVEYKPEISLKAQKVIRDEVSYSMISEDESSCQYDLMMCIEALEDYDDVYEEDIKKLYTFTEEEVHYIEF